MFGRSKSTNFKPYTFGQKKPARRMPRWLLWLLVGMVAGVFGVLFVQEEYLPPRLTAKQSEQITSQYTQVSTALQQTHAQLEQANQQLNQQREREQKLVAELEQARAALKPLQDDLELLQEVLPPDPRGGDLQIRAGRYFNRDGKLAYHLVLTRAQNGPAFKGTVQFAVEGRYPNGRTATVTLDPIPLQVGRYQNVQGEVALPDGLYARQITSRIQDAQGRTHAMRVINARN